MASTERGVAIQLEHGAVGAATWSVPARPRGVVVFAYGDGSNRRSVRNRFVAGRLQEAGFATLVLDLLTDEEEDTEALSGYLRFDVELLARRLRYAVGWVARSEAAGLPIGIFGASTGAAAALLVAAEAPEIIGAVASRSGRPDLAGENLRRVHAPTLLIVGSDDDVVLTLNERALLLLPGAKELVAVDGATQSFEEPGALEVVADHAARWFNTFLVDTTAHHGAER